MLNPDNTMGRVCVPVGGGGGGEKGEVVRLFGERGCVGHSSSRTAGNHTVHSER